MKKRNLYHLASDNFVYKRKKKKNHVKREYYVRKENYLKMKRIIYEKEKIIPTCKPHGPQLNMSGP